MFFAESVVITTIVRNNNNIYASVVYVYLPRPAFEYDDDDVCVRYQNVCWRAKKKIIVDK